MSLCIAVVSGKGGTGKSTISSSLAIALSRSNKKTVLIDLDMGLSCLDIFFGIEQSVVFDLYDAINAGEYENAFYYSKEYGENICIVPAPTKNKVIAKNKFEDFFDYCKQKFDAVILDLPAGLDFSMIENINGLKFLCVSNPDPVAIRDASVISDILANQENRKPLLIVNKFDPELIKNKIYRNIDDIIDLSGIKLLGIVPNSLDLMLLSVNHKLNKRSKSYKAINRITRRLSGENVPLPKPQKI